MHGIRRLAKRFFGVFAGSPGSDPGPSTEPRSDVDELEHDSGDPAEEVTFEVGDVLDLHSFPPKEIKDLVRDYLDHACEQGWSQVRIIHGKGVGVQRRTVRSILERDPRVVTYGDPPGESGGWGATWVQLSTDRPSGGSNVEPS